MRITFDTIDELRKHLKSHLRSKATPYVVEFDGITKYVLSNNPDQAIAIVARSLGAKVESVPISELLEIG